MPKKLNVEYVYAGALLHEEQVVYSYVALTAKGLGDAIVFMKPLSKHKVGSVLKFTAIDESDNLVAGSVRFKEMWHDQTAVFEWSGMSQAILVSEEAYQKAIGQSKVGFAALDPLRDAYSKLKGREKAVLLAQISAYIVGED